MSEPLMSYRETARMLGICEKTVQGMVKRGELPHIRIGRAVRFWREDLTAWIVSKREGVRDDAAQ